MPLSLDGTGSITGIGTFNFSDEIVHVGDTDTKIRFPSADTISLETAGTEKVRLTSNGNLGINRTTPVAPISARRTDAGGTGTSGVIAEFANSSGYGVWFGQSSASGASWGATTGDFYWNTGGLSSQVERLRIDSSGRLLKSGEASLTSTSLSHPVQIAADASAQNIVCYGRASDDISAIDFYEADKTTNLGELQYRRDHLNLRHRVGDIRFATGGTTERLRIDANGKVIIGNEYVNAANANAAISLFLSGTRSGSYGGQTTNAIIFDNQTAAVDAGGSIILAGYSGTQAIAKALIRGGNEGSASTQDGYFSVFTRPSSGNLTERFRITSAGDVGIGIENPAALTHIYDSPNTTAATEQFRISGGNRTADTFETGFRFFTQSPSANGNRHIRFTSNGNTGLTIQGYETSSGNAAVDRHIALCPSGGSVNIGGNPTQSNAPLSVTTDANDYGIRILTGSNVVFDILNNDSSGNAELRGYYNNNSGTRGEGFRLESNGNTFFSPTGSNRTFSISNAEFQVNNQEVQITSSSSYATHFNYQDNGSHYISFAQTGSTTFRNNVGSGQVMIIYGSGNIGAPNGNNIYNASDERLKENMVELTDGLEKIKKLKPYSFTWKKGFDQDLEGVTQYGFGAHQAKSVDEKLVEKFSENDIELDGETIKDPLRVNEKHVIPLLVKAIQELSAKVAALEGS